MRAARIVLIAALLSAACQASRDDSSRRVVTASRPVGSWQGTGSQSVGDINSDTGRFHITWETRREQPTGQGTFKLTVRSAVSGRPLQVVVDHRGEGSGQADFADAGRIYDFLVDSNNLEWSFSVVEIYEAYSK
ncbi:MAG: hypothetical protein ACRD2N_08365 [Vicinamibacterales bacterium]